MTFLNEDNPDIVLIMEHKLFEGIRLEFEVFVVHPQNIHERHGSGTTVLVKKKYR